MVDNAPSDDRLDAMLESNAPETTRTFARTLGEVCAGGELLLLQGDLGSGKTCFVQGLAVGLGVPDGVRVTSPTFTLHGEYPGRLVLNHLDLYRLEEPSALEGLGIDDMIADRSAVTAVEWPELLSGMTGREYLEIRLTEIGDSARNLGISSFGPLHVRLLRTWLDLIAAKR